MHGASNEANRRRRIRGRAHADFDKVDLSRFLDAGAFAKCLIAKSTGATKVLAECTKAKVSPQGFKPSSIPGGFQLAFGESVNGGGKHAVVAVSMDKKHAPKLNAVQSDIAPLPPGAFNGKTPPACAKCMVPKYAATASIVARKALSGPVGALGCGGKPTPVTVVGEGLAGPLAAMLAYDLAASKCEVRLLLVDTPKPGNKEFSKLVSTAVPSSLTIQHLKAPSAGIRLGGNAHSQFEHVGVVVALQGDARPREIVTGKSKGVIVCGATSIYGVKATAPMKSCEAKAPQGSSPLVAQDGFLADLAVT